MPNNECLGELEDLVYELIPPNESIWILVEKWFMDIVNVTPIKKFVQRYM